MTAMAMVTPASDKKPTRLQNNYLALEQAQSWLQLDLRSVPEHLRERVVKVQQELAAIDEAFMDYLKFRGQAADLP